MSPSADKNPFVDLLTAVWIITVLFLHHGWFVPSIVPTIPNLSLLLMYWSVGGFLFLSGYKLALSSPTSAREFFRRRFLRIYPLYILAIALYVAFVWVDRNPANIAMHLLGMQIVLPNF